MSPEPPGRDALPFPAPVHAFFLAAVAALARLLLTILLSEAAGRFQPAFLGIGTLVAFAGALAFAMPRIPPSAASLGFRPAPLRAWLAVPCLLPTLLLASELDNVIAPLLADASPPTPEAGPGELAAWLELLCVFALAIPLAEEIFYRGLIQSGLERTAGVRLAVWLTVALQALGTIPPGVRPLTNAVPAALVLCYLRSESGSVSPAIALGCAFGLVRVLAIGGVLGIPGFDDTSAPHTPPAWLVPAALLCVLGLLLCRGARAKP